MRNVSRGSDLFTLIPYGLMLKIHYVNNFSRSEFCDVYTMDIAFGSNLICKHPAFDVDEEERNKQTPNNEIRYVNTLGRGFPPQIGDVSSS